MSKPLITSLVIISFILGMGTGFTLSPEYANKMATKQSTMKELGNPDKFLDLRYLDNVIAHHQSAIYMAKQAETETQRPEIKSLAQEIIKVDEASIIELYTWKKSWYKNSKQIINYEKINLGKSDNNFDLRFLNALIAHHDEAIMGGEEIRTKSNRNEVLTLADSIIEGLTKSKTQLLTWRKSWYKI